MHDIESRDQVIEDLSKRIDELEAEVERLKAHTWQQERAAVVEWLRATVDIYEAVEHGEEWPEDVTRSLCNDIERGEHWPEGERHDL